MRRIKKPLVYSLLLVIGLIFTKSTLHAQSAEEALKNFDEEKYENATATIKKAIEKDPEEASNYYYAGYIYVNLDKVDSAKLYFDKGVSVDPKEPLNYVGQGYIALNNGKPQVAQQLFDQALSLSKQKNPEVYNKIADALIHADTKDANKALSYLQKATTLKKDKKRAAQIEVETNILMGDAYLALGDGGKAISSYERALTIDPKLAKAHTKIGRIYLIPKNYEAAEAEFQKALQVDPNYAPVYRELGELNFTKRDIRKAKEMYTKYRELSNVQGSRIAIIDYLMRDYPTAITELKEALTTDPNNIVLHRLLGYSLYQTGEYQAAKESLDKYFSIVKPEKTIAADYENYGKILMKLGEDSLAVQNFYTAIEKDTSNIDMLSDAAEELRKEKKFTQAGKLYDILLTKKKDLSANDYLYAGITYLYGKEFDKAEAQFKKVIELQPDHYAGYSYLALTQFYQDPENKQGLAKPNYEKVVSILEADTSGLGKTETSSLMTAYKYLASYYTQKEDYDSAKVQWDKVKKLNPNDTDADKFYQYMADLEAYRKKVEKAKAQQSKK